MKNTPDSAAVRLDQWLHAARFYKTRALSAQAIKSGKILLNDSKVKPAHLVRIDDRLSVKRGDELQQIIVRGISKRRGSATLAALLYDETEESVLARAAQREKRTTQADQAPHPKRRPDKKSRRQLIDFIRGNK